MKTEVIEVVLFKPKAEVSPDTLKKAALPVNQFLSKQLGYKGRDLAVSENSQWVDIVRWESLENAHTAQEAAMKSTACLPYFSMIDEATMQMYHFEVAL
ncbi:MAG: hypothetical protein GY755_05825 [Chloroflexi bacterium]|nr:hypothetical protein [Chloroflexota bacterium]